jgi:20S proteasome subunit beta 1
MKRALSLPLLAVVVSSLIATALIRCIRATTASSSSSSSFARRPLLGHQYRGGGGSRGLKNNDEDEIRMGTTILAVRYHGGIITGADTRTSSNGYVTNRYATKLTFVLDPIVDDYITTTTRMMTSRTDDKEQKKKQRITVVSSTRSRQQQQQRINNPTAATTSTCVICRSGSAADTQTLTSMVQCELLSRQVLHNIHGTVTHAASLLHTLLLNDNDNSGMSASLICTGYDHELHRGVIYTINKGGLLFEETYYSCLGSGSTYIIGHLDSYYNTCHCQQRQCLLLVVVLLYC